MLQDVMSCRMTRVSYRIASWVLGFVVCVAGASAGAQALPDRGAVPGLLIGFKPGVIGAPEADDVQGPRGREGTTGQARARRAALEGRARAARVAREAGVAVPRIPAAGDGRRIALERPLFGQALDDAMRRVRLHPDVAWVEPDVLVPLQQATPVVPDDSLFIQQWHLQAPDASQPVALNLPAAWARQTGAVAPGSAAVVVAVVDSGVRLDHPDLAGRLLPGYDLVREPDIANDGDGRDGDASDPGDWVHADDLQLPVFAGCTTSHSSWHGTFIAGQIAAATNNAAGIAGLSWGAQVLPVRVSGKCGARLSDLLEGLLWAAGLPVEGVPDNPNPARVINLSFGGDTACSPAYQETIDAVTKAGTLVVVAAGNGSGALKRPADCQRVMAVASVQRDGAKAGYSRFGPGVALAAPGGSGSEGDTSTEITSLGNSGLTVPAINGIALKQGTSFAAPQAAGVVSLMLAVNPALTPAHLIERMQAAARPHVDTGLAFCSASTPAVCGCTSDTCGAGLLTADRSVELASGPAAMVDTRPVVLPGALITLDASRSAAVPGATIETFLWSQVGGPAVTLSRHDQAVVTAQLPTSEASYRFRLTVTDSDGQTGQSEVTVVASVQTGGGGGSSGWAWGAALWVWVLAIGSAVRRQRHPG